MGNAQMVLLGRTVILPLSVTPALQLAVSWGNVREGLREVPVLQVQWDVFQGTTVTLPQANVQQLSGMVAHAQTQVLA